MTVTDKWIFSLIFFAGHVELFPYFNRCCFYVDESTAGKDCVGASAPK